MHTLHYILLFYLYLVLFILNMETQILNIWKKGTRKYPLEKLDSCVKATWASGVYSKTIKMKTCTPTQFHYMKMVKNQLYVLTIQKLWTFWVINWVIRSFTLRMSFIRFIRFYKILWDLLQWFEVSFQKPKAKPLKR